MAVPDPHMDEMRLMSYEAKPRACKQLYRIPRRNNFIQVLWCLDHLPGLPSRWCAAEVLHVSDSPAQECLAMGVIRYTPGDTWDEQVHRVEFLDNHKLRRATDEDDINETLNENLNPELEWQFTNGYQDASEEGDFEWDPASSQGQAVTREFQHRSEDRTDVEITALRTGHAALALEVEKLKREVGKHANRLSQMQAADYQRYECASAGCVLPRLRHRLALKMQAGLRPFSHSTGKRTNTESEQTVAVRTGDGLQVGTLKARVECTLQQFESLARQIRATSSPEAVRFFPDFSHTQQPLQCSSAFRIVFRTLAELLKQIGVTSSSDRLEMMRKCGTCPQGNDVLRILGTYSFKAGETSSAAQIYLGTSCGSFGKSTILHDQEGAHKLYPVLTRETREWNMVDNRFVHTLQMQRKYLPELDATATEVQAFGLQWKRAPELGARTWSKSLLQPAQVFGSLDACLPFIQTKGRHLCTEVGGLATDEIWEELLHTDPCARDQAIVSG